MISMLIRMTVAIIVALLLSIAGVQGNNIVLQTLFTVLGIVFSISMSLLVSFNLSKILNKKMRKAFRFSIEKTRNALLKDFLISTVIMITALIWNNDNIRIKLSFVIVDVMLIAVSLVSVSLLFEIYNFRKIHKLHTDIEDAVIDEEIKKLK